MEEEILNVLNQVAKKENWNNFEANLNLDNVKGNGFLGEFFFGTVKNKHTNQVLHLAIKKSLKNPHKREQMQIPTAYSNEIFFYSTIIPTLAKFRKEKGMSETLSFFCKCYITCSEEFNEMLVFENVRKIGFDILERETYFNEEYIAYIFETYGVVHGLSFAYKDQHTEDYKKLTGGLEDFFLIMKASSTLPPMIKSCSKQVLEFLEGKVKDRCRDFLQNTDEEFFKSLKYSGEYSCITHGDCWSNNMMFKYTNKLDGIKLVDFQLSRIGSPVNDLSYMFYGCVSKELLQNLNKYLVLYYNSFSKTVSDLGSDPKEIFPFEAFMEDWKKYAKFGLLMGLMLRKLKLISHELIQKMASDNGNVFTDLFNEAEIDTKIYKEETIQLVQHFYENNFI